MYKQMHDRKMQAQAHPPAGPRDGALPPGLEAALRRRAEERAEQPWLALRVETQVELREQARRWLAGHPRGLTGAPLRERAGRLAELLGSAPLRFAAAILAAALAGWWLASQPGLHLPTLAIPGGAPAAVAATLALLSAAALSWPRLRGYYL